MEVLNVEDVTQVSAAAEELPVRADLLPGVGAGDEEAAATSSPSEGEAGTHTGDAEDVDVPVPDVPTDDHLPAQGDDELAGGQPEADEPVDAGVREQQHGEADTSGDHAPDAGAVYDYTDVYANSGTNIDCLTDTRIEWFEQKVVGFKVTRMDRSR